MGNLRGVLVSFWGPLGAPGGFSGAIWVLLGPLAHFWGLLGASWGPLRGLVGPLGSLPGASWDLLGASWGLLGTFGSLLGASWGPFWSSLGGLVGRLGVLVSRKARKRWEGHGGFEREIERKASGEREGLGAISGRWVRAGGILGKMEGSESSCGGGTHVVGKVMGGGSEEREDALGLKMIVVRKRSRSSVE